MTTPTPKTLEYSTIKRSRKRVAMIVVLVLASLAVAIVGRAWLGRFLTAYDRYRSEISSEWLIQDDIRQIEQGNLTSVPSALLGTDLPFSKGWARYPARSSRTSPIISNITACVAELDAGQGMRFVGCSVNLTPGLQPAAATVTISVIRPTSIFASALELHTLVRPLVTYYKTLKIQPGTRDPNHPDRATFKVIADGVEKTFVVILRKDDTVAFEEQPSN